MTTQSKALPVFFLTLLFSFPVFADWTLNSQQSAIHFTSIKAENMAEIHRFKSLTGSVDNQGQASLQVSLASVDTNIPVRNERMKAMLFEIQQFPVARISTAIDPEVFTNSTPGTMRKLSTTLQVSLHGKTVELPATLNVTFLKDQRVHVTTASPIILNAASFSLTTGIERLKTVAGLSSISLAVPVTVDLLFEKQ